MIVRKFSNKKSLVYINIFAQVFRTCGPHSGSKTKSSAFHKSHATDTPYTTNSLATARQQKYSIEGMSLFSDPHNRNPSPCDPNLTRFLLPPLIIDLLFNAVLFSTHATAWINCIGHIIFFKKKKLGCWFMSW